MIVVDINLVSAVSRDRDQNLGTLIICNDGIRSVSSPSRGTYECRMYARGKLEKKDGDPARLWAEATPTRHAWVTDHARLTEPVQNLVAKALERMGYRS